MRILAIDIGTGTQDILLFDSSVEPENCYKLVMPAPTTMQAAKVRRATAAAKGLVLSGVTMGGGPVGWALEEHIKRGLPVFATPDAARTFNDDLAEVEATGVGIVDEVEAARLAASNVSLRLCDLDLETIWAALRAFDIDGACDGLAVAVLDHGNAPPGVSDRVFRFDHIRTVIERASAQADQLLAFAYKPEDLPAYLTRMKAVVRSAGDIEAPMILLDTGAAAALGARQDARVAGERNAVLLNLGNMHALATHLQDGRIVGVFEHHTGFVDAEKLDDYLGALISGTLENSTIFNDKGHGAYIVADAGPRSGGVFPFLSVTGPRRSIMRASRLRPYFAVPHGDMMIAGCFGLVRGWAARYPQWQEEINFALGQT